LGGGRATCPPPSPIDCLWECWERPIECQWGGANGSTAKPAVYRVYEQCEQIGDLNAGIVVRTAVEPASIVAAVRRAIWSIDKNQPLARIQTMEAIVDRQLSTSSQSTAVLNAFALLALLLASLGLYGVLSYA